MRPLLGIGFALSFVASQASGQTPTRIAPRTAPQLQQKPVIAAPAVPTTGTAPVRQAPAGPAPVPAPTPTGPTAPVKVETPALADVKKPVLRRGTIQSLRTRQVDVAGAERKTIAALADTVFAAHRSITRALKDKRAGLLSDPVVREEAIETADETVLVTTTEATIVDSAKVGTAMSFTGLRPNAPVERVLLASLDAAQRSEFDVLKQSLAQKPATHPLRLARAHGDQALLDAIVAGKGDFSLTTTVVVKKQLKSPIRTVSALPAHIGPATGAPQAPTGAQVLERLPADAHPLGTSQMQYGKAVSTARLLNGFTVSDSFTWELRWSFPGGHFRITPEFSYALGARVPIEVTAELEPSTVQVTGAVDRPATVTTHLSARTTDGSPDFYRATGLPADQVFGGDELVISGRAGVHIKLKALWKVWLDKFIGLQYRHSDDFEPALEHEDSITELWIPGSVTGTKATCCLVNLVLGACVPTCAGSSEGTISGGVEFGVGLGGQGTLSFDYEALYGGQVIPTIRSASQQVFYEAITSLEPTRDASKEGPLMKRRPLFDSAGTRTYTSELAPLTAPGDRSFGFRISNASYLFKPVITPLTRISYSVDLPGFDRTWTFPTELQWLVPALAPDFMGWIEFERHSGTTGSYDFNRGTKKFRAR